MIDSLSDLLVNHDAASVRELLEILGSQIHQRNGLVFMHLEGKLRFYKMRRAQLRPMLLPFSITDRGVMAETFGRVI